MNRYEERSRKLQSIFQDTMRGTQDNVQLAEATAVMAANTKVYLEELSIDNCAIKNEKINISVVEDTTFSCASKIVGQGKIAVLNFANPVHPGGGVVRGAIAQEESLCRSSNLYAGLTSPQMRENYYERNQKRSNKTGSDSIGYHPAVTVFKDDQLFPRMLSTMDWFQVDVITCAAPIIEPWSGISELDLYRIHVKRGKRIIKAAVANNVDILILGAFGCGAFNNNPEIVATAYRDLLIEEDYARFFKQVVFAIKKDHNDRRENYYHFNKVLFSEN